MAFLLYCAVNILFNDVKRPSVVLHLSCSVYVNDSMNCRPFMPSQFFIIAIFSACGLAIQFEDIAYF